jgi:hypothetical protein
MALHHEAVGAPHGLGRPDVNLTVGEGIALQSAQPHPETVGYLGGEGWVGSSGEEHHSASTYEFHISVLMP